MTFKIVRSWSKGSVDYTSIQKLGTHVAVYARNRFLAVTCHRIASLGFCLISAEIKEDDTVQINSSLGTETWKFVMEEDQVYSWDSIYPTLCRQKIVQFVSGLYK